MEWRNYRTIEIYKKEPENNYNHLVTSDPTHSRTWLALEKLLIYAKRPPCISLPGVRGYTNHRVHLSICPSVRPSVGPFIMIWRPANVAHTALFSRRLNFVSQFFIISSSSFRLLSVILSKWSGIVHWTLCACFTKWLPIKLLLNEFLKF